MDAFVIRTPKTSQSSTKDSNKSAASSSSISRGESYNNQWLSKSSTNVLNSSSTFNHPSSSSEVGALNKIKPDRGQRRIADLGGVVVIERIQKYVEKLSDPNIPSVAKVLFIKLSSFLLSY